MGATCCQSAGKKARSRLEGKRDVATWAAGARKNRSLIGFGNENGLLSVVVPGAEELGLDFLELAVNKAPMNSEPESRPFPLRIHGLAGAREIKNSQAWPRVEGRWAPTIIGDGKSHVMGFVVERYPWARWSAFSVIRLTRLLVCYTSQFKSQPSLPLTLSKTLLR